MDMDALNARAKALATFKILGARLIPDPSNPTSQVVSLADVSSDWESVINTQRTAQALSLIHI